MLQDMLKHQKANIFQFILYFTVVVEYHYINNYFINYEIQFSTI